MSKIGDKVREKWDAFEPKDKKKLVRSSITAGLLIMMIISYQMGGRKTVTPTKAPEKKPEVLLEPNLLEKSLYMEKEKELRQRDEQLKELKKDIEEMKKTRQEEATKIYQKEHYPPVPVPAPPAVQTSQNEPGKTGYPSVPPPPRPGTQKQPDQMIVGKIEVFHNPYADKVKADAPAEGGSKKKENTERIYLPPSFMPAVLMTGIRAKTGSDGKGEGQPLLLRITDLAVLPNRITKDLKDCFVVADARGDLAMERADVRLVSMNCLARDGTVAINQKIKGTVVDADGVLNLDGKVVARWGSTLAAASYAGFFGGIGEGLQAASTETLTSTSGSLSTIEPGKTLMAASGSGLSSSFSKIADFMLEIAKQATPVVEVGNLKPVTVFISEGVEMEVKKYCSGLSTLGEAKCKETM